MMQLKTILVNYRFLILSLFFLIGSFYLFEYFIDKPENISRFTFFSLVGIIYFYFLNKNESIILPNKYLLISFFAFYIYNLISIFWSLNIASSIFEAQRVGIGLISLILFVNYFKKKENYTYFLKSYIIFLLIILIQVSIETYNIIGPWISKNGLYQVHSFFSHKNVLSSFLFLSLCISTLAIINLKKRWKTIAIITSILTFIFLLFLFSRSVYVSLFATVFFIGVFNYKIIFQNKSSLILTTVLLIIIGSSFLYFNNKVHYQNTKEITASKSVNERLLIWEKTIHLIKEKPILGCGAGNWQYNYLKYSVDDITNIAKNNYSFQKPHNDFLWIISELGFIGFIIFLSIILFVVKPFFKQPQLLKNTELNIIISFIIGLFFISFFSFPKERVSHIILTMIILSLIIIKSKNVIIINRKRVSNLLTSFIIVILSFNLFIAFYIVKGKYYTKLLLREKQKNNSQKVIEYSQKAISTFYLNNEDSTPLYSYLGWGYMVESDYKTSLFYSQKAYQISPYDFEVLSNYGMLLMVNKRLNDAEIILQKSYEINPYFEPTLYNLFTFNYNIGNYEKSKKFLEMIPNYEKNHIKEIELLDKKLK